MSEHKATIAWKRDTEEFTYKTYTRDHTWTFPNGIAVPASAAPAFLGSEERVDPEEAFVASLSACHMLTLLALCTKKRWVVDQYTDNAVGFLEKNEDGRLAITRVTLRPRIEFSGDNIPSPQDLEWLHDTAHHQCFLATSVKTHITVE